MLLQVKCTEFISGDCGYLDCRSSGFIQSYSSPFEILLQTATGAQDSERYMRQPTHCSRNKNLVSPDINKKKLKETIFLPRLVRLLRNKNVNKYYQLQKGEDSAR
jgi:hypothetical protein